MSFYRKALRPESQDPDYTVWAQQDQMFGRQWIQDDSTARSPDVAAQRVIDARTLQKHYNAAVELIREHAPEVFDAKCAGFISDGNPKLDQHGKLKPKGEDGWINECGLLMCPACWHKTQSFIYSFVLNERLQMNHWYIRYTECKNYDQPIDPRVIKRFVGNGTEYQTVAWTYAVEEDGSRSPVSCVYSLVGIFGSDRPLRDRYADRGGWVLQDGHEIKGVLVTESFDNKFDMLVRWEELNPHPSKVRGLSEYPLYILGLNRLLDGKKKSLIRQALVPGLLAAK